MAGYPPAVDPIEIMFVVLWLGVPILAAQQILASRRDVPERTCPNCEYDLAGTPVGTLCPECGKLPTVARSRRVDPDRVRCRNCGHDLVGLKWDTDCPECGLHSAAIPKFQLRRSRYRSRALLGSILLAIWLGLTIVVVTTPTG